MQWKEIEGFEDYLISTEGQVFSKKRNKQLKPTIKKSYQLVYLYNKEKRKSQSVHRLVAKAFIDNPNNYPQINHKDENSLNNRVENLEWCDAKYNSNYGHHREKLSKALMGRKGKIPSAETREKQRQAKLGKPSKRKKTIMIDGILYESITEAMNKTGYCTRKIYKIIKENEKDV